MKVFDCEIEENFVYLKFFNDIKVASRESTMETSEDKKIERGDDGVKENRKTCPDTIVRRIGRGLVEIGE